MNKDTRLNDFFVSQFYSRNTLSALVYKRFKQERRDRRRRLSGKMSRQDLINLIVTPLHSVAGPCHLHRGRRGGRCHRRPVLASAPPQPLPSAIPHHRVLEQPPSPSLDWSAYRPMEPSDPNTSPWGRQGRPCVIHGWGPCPNQVALVHGPSSSSR
jgi:hypothetical protein